MKALVTGGAGFIGSNLVDRLIADGHTVTVIDNESADSNEQFYWNPQAHNYKYDVRDYVMVRKLYEGQDAVFHLAAESHVDRSIEGPEAFIQTNLVGTYRLLQAAREHQKKMKNGQDLRFLHVSTDEVFGTLGADDPAFTEETPYRPNSPYSASKAGSDHLARAWHHTFGLPVIITNCSNNYGARQ